MHWFNHSGSSVSSVIAALLLAAACSADAAVTTIARYPLGELDSGASAGTTAANPTTASVGAVNLARVGTPTYSAQVVPRPTPLSVAFNGSTDGYRAATTLTAVTDNFGVEAWVRPTSATGGATIAYNGNTSTSGWGLFRNGSSYAILFGGNTLTSAPGSVVLNQWTHLALVRSAGVTTLYKNGVAITSTPIGPNVPAGAFAVGINPTVTQEFFAGEIDEVRVFTFAAGQFATSDLLTGLSYTPAIPALSWQAMLAMLFAVVGLGAAFLRQRQRQ